jgi:hypothetical protein
MAKYTKEQLRAMYSNGGGRAGPPGSRNTAYFDAKSDNVYTAVTTQSHRQGFMAGQTTFTMQAALAAGGHLPCSGVDGSWGPQTQNAVRAATRASGGNFQAYMDRHKGQNPCGGAGGGGGGWGGGGRGGGGGGGGGGGPQTVTATTTQVRLTDRNAARQMLRSALKAEMGRAPSNAEFNKFLGLLHAAEKENPTVSKSTTTTTPGTSSSSVTKNETVTEGLDSGGYTEEYARTKVDAQERSQYQATGYYDQILSMAGGL